MTVVEHVAFGKFQFYLDKDAVIAFSGDSMLCLGTNFFLVPRSSQQVQSTYVTKNQNFVQWIEGNGRRVSNSGGIFGRTPQS